MILADTSVWVQHFRQGEPRLVDCLMQSEVVIHPYIIGELALGSISDRRRTLADLSLLPSVSSVETEEILSFIEARRLFSLGLGYVDVNLLAATILNQDVRLWTFDRRLADAAKKIGIAYEVK